MAANQSDTELVLALQALIDASRWFDWKMILTFAAGTVAATAGAFVNGLVAKSAAERDARRREADRLRDRAEKAQLSALRLAVTIEGFGHQAAQWHAQIEDDEQELGGQVSALPDLTWPAEIGWEALGIATANEALAFEIDVRHRQERLDGAFQYDGDVGSQLIPTELLAVANAAATLARHIRETHKIGRPHIVKSSGWEWRAYVDGELRKHEAAKAQSIEAAAKRRARPAKAL